jgi:5,10-methylene-tetrahydrofolate dehydrogenase/methenyl tetrahydrofolate cyclohydrolase
VAAVVGRGDGQETVEEAILEANDDDSVDGIMVRVCGVLLRRDF